MNSSPQPSPIRFRDVLIAFVVSAILLLFVAFGIVWMKNHMPKPAPQPPEEFLSEFRFEPRDTPEPDASTSSEDHPTDVKSTAKSTPDSEQQPPERAPEPTPKKEPEPKTPPAVTVVIPPDRKRRRQSVDQPTSNDETPESDHYYLSEVNNTAEQETVAEDTTTEYQPDAKVDQRSQDSESEQPPKQPEPTRNKTSSKTKTPNERQDETPKSTHDTTAKGAPDQPAEQRQKSEAGPKAPHDQRAQEKGDHLQKKATTPIAEGKNGHIHRNQDAQAAESFGEASGLGSQMRQAAKRSEDNGRGHGSVTRGGAEYAKKNFDKVLGKKTAEYEARVQQSKKDDSLLGDQEGQWQRTRKAMENYDIAVTAGTETMLNTRRDDSAGFINAYHAKIHAAWWQAVAILNQRDGSADTNFEGAAAVTLEIRVLADGTVKNVAIISSSGDTFMDAEAIRVNYAVGKGPAPPNKIMCDDGSVYLHWTFSRGPAHCTTQGASVHCPKKTAN